MRQKNAGPGEQEKEKIKALDSPDAQCIGISYGFNCRGSVDKILFPARWIQKMALFLARDCWLASSPAASLIIV